MVMSIEDMADTPAAFLSRLQHGRRHGRVQSRRLAGRGIVDQIAVIVLEQRNNRDIELWHGRSRNFQHPR
jgi:hypothetical protein